MRDMYLSKYLGSFGVGSQIFCTLVCWANKGKLQTRIPFRAFQNIATFPTSLGTPNSRTDTFRVSGSGNQRLAVLSLRPYVEGIEMSGAPKSFTEIVIVDGSSLALG